MGQSWFGNILILKVTYRIDVRGNDIWEKRLETHGGLYKAQEISGSRPMKN